MSSLGYLFYEPIVQLPTNVSTHGGKPTNEWLLKFNFDFYAVCITLFPALGIDL